MTDSNYTRGQGRLVVDRYDFQKHIEGTDFRHKAIGIDLETPLTALQNADDVQTAFDNLNDYIESLVGIGEGFITVGSGYDTWHNANGSVNYDSAIPPLNDILQPIFDAILVDSSYSAAYDRIRFGGIIVIKAGTYIVTDTIDVPPGITIMGEGWGTKIVNATSLNLGLMPPEVDLLGTPKPVFRIKADLDRAVTDTIIGTDAFAFNRKTKICNLMISDNFPEFTQTGDLQYLKAQNISGDTPLISQEAGSYLSLESVSMFGRVAFSEGTDVSSATTFAVQLDASTAVTTGTILSAKDCFMDGFSQPIEFFTIGGTNDYLEVNNCKIRAHGWLDADGTNEEKNCCISMNDNNAIITSNYFYGNHSVLKTIVNINAVLGAPPVLQGKSKIVIASNDFAIDKTSVVTTIAPNILYSAVSYDDNATVVAYGNTMQEAQGFKVEVNSGAQLSITSTVSTLTATDILNLNGTNLVDITSTTQIDIGSADVNITGSATVDIDSADVNITGSATVDIVTPTVNLTTPTNGGMINLNGALTLRLNTITSTPYTVDSSVTDAVILVDLTTIASAATITLPEPTAGRSLIIKDRDGYAGSYNIILDPLDGYADYYIHNGYDGYDAVYTGAKTHIGQSFTGDGHKLTSVKFYLSKQGSPTGTAVARIYAHTGSFGTSSVPTGSALATSGTFSVSTLSSLSYSIAEFTFTGSNRMRLVNGTNYIVAIEYTGGSGVSYVKVAKDSSSPTHDGNKSTETSNVWTADAGEDAIFYVHTSDSIEGIPGPATFSANFGSWTLVGDGTDWSII